MFVTPLVVYSAVFLFAPMIMAFVYSLTDWNMLSDAAFIGLKNYIELFGNRLIYPYFWKSLWVTVKYILFTIPASLFGTLVVSAMLNSISRGVKFFKTAFYIPSVTAGVAIMAMWRYMLDSRYGMINQLLGTHINFLGETSTALLTLAVMSVWGGLGYNVLIMLSAMKNIDTTYYEAAEIDGANAFEKFWRITLPSVMPTTFFLLVTGLIGSFQAFDQMKILTGGGPQHSTYTFMYQIYEQAFDNLSNIGVACALSYILFGFILLITLVQFKVMPQRTDKEEKKKGVRRRARNA